MQKKCKFLMFVICDRNDYETCLYFCNGQFTLSRYSSSRKKKQMLLLLQITKENKTTPREIMLAMII